MHSQSCLKIDLPSFWHATSAVADYFVLAQSHSRVVVHKGRTHQSMYQSGLPLVEGSSYIGCIHFARLTFEVKTRQPLEQNTAAMSYVAVLELQKLRMHFEVDSGTSEERRTIAADCRTVHTGCWVVDIDMESPTDTADSWSVVPRTHLHIHYADIASLAHSCMTPTSSMDQPNALEPASLADTVAERRDRSTNSDPADAATSIAVRSKS